MTGQPILANQFGSSLVLAVEIAFGADIAADPSTWTWTDVTADVRNAGQIAAKVGRADEANTPQPADCKFVLTNTTGRYSKGPKSPYYPYVRENTPVRVRVILSGTSYTRWQGDAVGFTPGWDLSNQEAIVNVQAAGTKRRLGQGKSPIQSTLRRSIPGLSSLVAYWPCEEGSRAGQFASANGGQPLSISGTPQPAAYSGFLGSSPIPTLQADSWSGQVPAYADSGSGQVRFLLATPTSTPADQAPIVTLSTAGTVTRLELRYLTGGALRLIGFDRVNTTIVDSGALAFGLGGQAGRCSVQWTNSGGNLNFTVSFLAVGTSTAAYVNFTTTGQSINGVTNLAIAAGGSLQGVSIGHIYVQNTSDDIFTLLNQLNAYNGESPTARLARLCAEQGEQITIVGSSNQYMGPQLPAAFLDLLEECAAADQGVLYDGVGPGLAYIARDARENRNPTMTLHAETGEVAGDFTPVDDDQQTTNTFTASRSGGASTTVTDSTSERGTEAIGLYDNSATFNVALDWQLADLAGWRVNLGTVPGYRYPELDMLIEHSPEILQYWLAVVISARLDVTGVEQVRDQFPDGLLSLMAEGWAETINLVSWAIVVNTTSYVPWRVAVLAAETGDTNPFVARLDTDGATTVGDTPAGSTTMTVATASGPLWTTYSDDFPVDVNAGGNQVTVTNVTGTTSPQTFTVDPATVIRDIPAGSAVSLWQPPVLAM
jgi:hypothetical protein